MHNQVMVINSEKIHSILNRLQVIIVGARLPEVGITDVE